MGKGKKILLSFLALNSIISGSAAASSVGNLDVLYNKIVKNLNSNKSNDDNFKIIENILNKKNKELKDLYIQSDYIVKPEYLEWQIFFTGFYGEKRNGDNTKENAEYRSETEGYYDANGNYIATGGGKNGVPAKSYAAQQQPKEINLGVSIPIKGMTRDNLNLNITPAQEVSIMPFTGNIAAPVVEFNSIPVALSPFTMPDAPVVNVTPLTINVPAFSFPATGNGDDMWINSTGGVAPIAQINLNNDGTGNATGTMGTMNVDVDNGLFDVSMNNVDAVGVQGSAHTLTPNPNGYVKSTGIDYTNRNQVAVMKLVGGHNVYVDNLNINFGGTGASATPKMLFHIDAHNDHGSSVYHVGKNVNTNITGSNLMFFGIQYHYGNNDAGLINNGTITTSSGGSGNTIFATIGKAGGINTRNLYFTNNGTITLNGSKELLGLIDLPGAAGFGGMFTNDGTINMNGTDSFGLIVNSSATGMPKLLLNNPLNINGTGNKGIILQKDLDYSNSVFKYKIDGTNNLGLYTNYTPTTAVNIAGYDISTGANSSGSTLVRVDGGKFVFDNTGAISMKGTNNYGFIVSGANSDVSVDKDIASSGNGNVVLYSENGSFIRYAGTITTSGVASHGAVIGANGEMDDYSGKTASIKTSGDSSVTIYNKGKVSLLNGGTYAATGNKSSIIYNDGGTTDIKGANQYELGSNGVGFYVDGGKLTLDSNGGTSTVKIGSNSVLSSILTTNGIEFKNGRFDINLGTGATGFVYKGTGSGTITAADISTYLGNYYTGLNNLYFTMDPGSRLFVVEDYGTINLSDIQALSASGTVVNVVGGSTGKDAYLWKGSLIVDGSYGLIDLDNPSNALSNVERSAVGVTLNTGVTLKGTQAGQIGLADVDIYSMNYVKMINNGIIDLAGSDSVGIYTDNGTITNNGSVSVKGINSAALYAENSTAAVNAQGGTIIAGTKGVGIYGIAYQDISNPQTYGAGKINITNSGTITAETGSETIGIYANNNKPGGTAADSTVNLSTGTINMQNSEKGIGVYADKSTVTGGAGIITVGKNGTGIYAKDSNVTLTGSTINLFGDNSLGIYLDGSTSFSGNGTINIAGQNIILFNMASSGTVTNNFTVGTVAAGSTYTLGNIMGGVFEYTGSSVLNSNGTLVTGKNSAVYLNGSGISVNSGSTGVAAFALDGQYTGALPLPTGMTAGIDGENAGTISLENSSVAVYGKNGTRLSNKGTITVGDNSAGIITSGTGSSAQNSGTITAGSNSQGMLITDGTTAENKSGGSIISTGTGVTGIYTKNITGPVVNNGNINLSGDGSIGIYTTGTTVKTINNNGTLTIGDSADPNNPSIGIYSSNAGDTLINNGTVSSGVNSIGIYSAGGTVSQDGTMNIGDTGVGIYISDGSVTTGAASVFNFGTNSAVGVYGIRTLVTNNSSMDTGSGNYGFVLTDSAFTNNASNVNMGTDSVFLYNSGSGTVTNNTGTTITMNGSDNIAYYTVNGSSVLNNGNITGTGAKNNIGIYNTGGSVINNGTISVGDSELVSTVTANGSKLVDVEKSRYAVGIYGENSAVLNDTAGNISTGAGGIGITIKGGTAENKGIITGSGNNTMGMYSEGGNAVNRGSIIITGDDSIGMAGNGAGSQIENYGTIQVSGTNAIGIYGNAGTTVINGGTIIADGTNAQGIILAGGSKLSNLASGTIILNGGLPVSNYYVESGDTYTTPTIINSGVIKVSEKFETDGVNVVIKVDPTTVRKPTTAEVTTEGYDISDSGADYLISNAVRIEAPSFNITSPLQITGNFAEGTNVKKYKLEDMIIPGSGNGVKEGLVPVISKSLTWTATPVYNGAGNVDIWMEKIDYTKFTDGLWYQDFGRALEDNYETAGVQGIKIYDKIDVIETEKDFRHVMGSMAGNVYANMNQREEDIARALEGSLDLLSDSVNNTKENIKMNIIAGKGKTKDDTDGVTGYDYFTTGVLALREVERTYKHTFGYSLGYLHTGFEFNDGNQSEEWVDTMQLGVHNKYAADGWKLRNDLTGRVSFHNIDRNIDWPSPNGRSEMNGTYETYSITSDNILGKEFGIGKKVTITPYGGLRAMYAVRPSFSEKGLEALEVKGNDAWSVKPRAGIELKSGMQLGQTPWQLKGAVDFSYEYELADLNEREQARLLSVESGYHNLSKPSDENGSFRTSVMLGAEITDRYGIFLTGEYRYENKDKDDYRTGITLKAVF
jgi:hypothetical protein